MVGVNVLPRELLNEASGVLLVIAAAEETAKRIESHLRNAGHPLRTAWLSDLDELDDILRRDPPDLLLCEQPLAGVPLQRVLALCQQRRAELPVLALVPTLDADQTATLLGQGVNDCVSCTGAAPLRHLERVVIREFVHHHRLRQLNYTQQRLAEFQSRHQQLTEGTVDAVAHVQEGIFAGANAAFAKLLGMDDAASLIGTPMIDLVIPEQQSRVKERLRMVLKGRHNGEPLELALRGRGGRIDVKANLILGASDGESVIEMLVRNDRPVGRGGGKSTGGRIDFARALGKVAAEGLLRAALLIKLDRYAELEDRIGMIDAEEIRDRIAEAIRKQIEAGDELFVFSSDELALVVLRPDIGGVEALAQTLRTGISRQVYATRRHEAQVMLTAVVYPLGANEQIEALVQQLAGEVRKLSREGGDRISVLGEAAKAKVAEREQVQIAKAVKLAMDDNRLKLAYQSIASLEGEAQIRFDVLLRMIDETGNELHAGEFLPQAESAGMMAVIDRWVISRVLGVITKRGGDQMLFVKLSEDSIRDAESFLAWLRPELQKKPPPPNTLIFELQELTVQNHVRKAKALTQALAGLGIGLTLEHYGLGASSAQLLNHIPVQYLKFHPDFTRKFGDRELQRRLAELMETAKQHKLKTIVAHVEDAGVMARMWQMGVNFVQGYHVQEPEVVLLSGETEVRRH